MGNTGLCSNQNLLQVIHIVRTVINILQIAVPVALILWGTLDIGKAVIAGDEKKMNIIAKDSRSPYDFALRKKLVEAAEAADIPYTVSVNYRYGSDATTAILQGFDFKYACIGPSVDASHHYERTHNDGIIATVDLMIAYL